MHDSAMNHPTVDKDSEDGKILSGSINLISRVVPLIFEDKEFFMRSMWHE